MSYSDSDSEFDVMTATGMNGRTSVNRIADDNDSISSDDDSYADLFKPQRRRGAALESSRSGMDDDSSYTLPSRKHVCDECEATFDDAVYCGECAMTYCNRCDESYHSAAPELRQHYRHSLSGPADRSLAHRMSAAMTMDGTGRESSRWEGSKSERESSQAWAHETSGGGAAMAAQLAAAYPVDEYDKTLRVTFAADTIPRPVRPTSATQRRSPAASHSSNRRIAASSRPASSSLSRSSSLGGNVISRVPLRPTRMGVSTSATSLEGKSAFGRNMQLRNANATAFHQKPARTASSASASKKQNAEERGAHARPKQWGEESTSLLRKLHDEILSLKTELAALNEEKHHLKTAVLKRQNGLKEVGRVATHIAKQPLMTTPAPVIYSSSSSSSKHSTAPQKRSSVPSSSPSRSPSSSSKPAADLTSKVDHLHVSNEMLRLEIRQLQSRLDRMRQVQQARSTHVADIAALERERTALVKAVSTAAASRDLATFKQEQLCADLKFAQQQLQKMIVEKKKETAEKRMETMQMESFVQRMQNEYTLLQKRMDEVHAQQV